jgi:hypothetical protein
LGNNLHSQVHDIWTAQISPKYSTIRLVALVDGIIQVSQDQITLLLQAQIQDTPASAALPHFAGVIVKNIGEYPATVIIIAGLS